MVKDMIIKYLRNNFLSPVGERAGWCLDSGTSDASYREL
jgi:hypothetical protein